MGPCEREGLFVTHRSRAWLLHVGVLLGFPWQCALADEADLILHHGKIITVDNHFSVQEALAIRGDRILRVGTSADLLKAKGDKTRLVDLAGKTVLPGLIDSHTHPQQPRFERERYR